MLYYYAKVHLSYGIRIIGLSGYQKTMGPFLMTNGILETFVSYEPNLWEKRCIEKLEP